MFKFHQLLKLGQKYEQIAQNKICKLNNVSILIEQDEKNYKFIHYDFKTSDNICYEVKADFQSKTTENVFIEVSDMLSRPSGLSISTADYYIIYSEFEEPSYYKISIEKLKKLTEKYKHVLKFVKDGTRGFCVPMIEIKLNSSII